MPQVVIVGAGPAGTSAAISLAQKGFEVAILEASGFPRHRPGETLHPGIEPLFAQLQVSGTINNAGFVRHRGNNVIWEGAALRFEPFGEDDCGPWLGYQIPRMELDQILLERASECGATVLQRRRATGIHSDGDRILSVDTNAGPLTADWVLDASGRSHWLQHALKLPWAYESDALIARYGYALSTNAVRSLENPDCPLIRKEASGWTWIARITSDTIAWVRLRALDDLDREEPLPQEVAGLSRVGGTRSADVTWRISAQPAGRNWFLLGDSGMVLDPSSSHGVLRAIMSGLMAAHLISTSPGSGRRGVQEIYSEWLRDWFRHDVGRLRSFSSGGSEWGLT